jgi:hypothetical protein
LLQKPVTSRSATIAKAEAYQTLELIMNSNVRMPVEQSMKDLVPKYDKIYRLLASIVRGISHRLAEETLIHINAPPKGRFTIKDRI